MLNGRLERQARASLLSLYGKAVPPAAIPNNATAIGNPPTQAQVQSLQATINALVVQVNALTAALAPLLDAVNANLKSLPDTAVQEN